MIEDRGMFPSPQQRQCTSDLKRGPIERTIRCITRERQAIGMKSWGLIVNCMGMRAEESSSRKRLPAFKFSARNSKAGREWYDWLPIHEMLEEEVFATIAAAGQDPHPIYKLGMRRFSCVFCIMASEEDLKTAARLATTRPELLNRPDLYLEYVRLEKTSGQVMIMPTKSTASVPSKILRGFLRATSQRSQRKNRSWFRRCISAEGDQGRQLTPFAKIGDHQDH